MAIASRRIGKYIGTFIPKNIFDLKVGDTVRLKTEKDFDACPKDEDGYTIVGNFSIIPEMRMVYGDTIVVDNVYTSSRTFAATVDGHYLFWPFEIIDYVIRK